MPGRSTRTSTAGTRTSPGRAPCRGPAEDGAGVRRRRWRRCPARPISAIGVGPGRDQTDRDPVPARLSAPVTPGLSRRSRRAGQPRGRAAAALPGRRGRAVRGARRRAGLGQPATAVARRAVRVTSPVVVGSSRRRSRRPSAVSAGAVRRAAAPSTRPSAPPGRWSGPAASATGTCVNERVHIGWTAYGPPWWGVGREPRVQAAPARARVRRLRLRPGEDPDRRASTPARRPRSRGSAPPGRVSCAATCAEPTAPSGTPSCSRCCATSGPTSARASSPACRDREGNRASFGPGSPHDHSSVTPRGVGADQFRRMATTRRRKTTATATAAAPGP